MTNEEILAKAAKKAAGHVANRGATAALTKGIVDVGSKQFTKKYAETMATQMISGAAPNIAMFHAVSAAAATPAARVAAAAPVLGKLGGGVIVTPLVEVVALKLDGKEHTGREYATVAGHGVVCGAAGAGAGMLGAAATGAVIGSAVPIVGTLCSQGRFLSPDLIHDCGCWVRVTVGVASLDTVRTLGPSRGRGAVFGFRACTS